MGLKARPTDPFRLVCTHDKALDAISDSVMREYADSDREWAVIEPHLKGLDPAPVVFLVDPLRATHDSLAVTGSVLDMKLIFASHVRDISGVDADMMPSWVRGDEKNTLDLDYVAKFPLPWITDVVRAITDRGMGDISPFSLPDGFWRARSRRDVRRRVSQIGTAVHSITTVPDGSSS